MKNILIIFSLSFLSISFLEAQEEKDSVQNKELSTLLVEGTSDRNIVKRLPAVAGTYIFSGKKSEVIALASLDANITDKVGRQVFAKIPGVFVYDMDGAGNQINIATRGLDPHRGWEFNTRKNGIITNSDMYGYPASHYSIPLESVERIELVRGTGSLQYGAQFGGMLNYVTKRGDTTRPYRFETNNSVGSYRLLSSYNAVGGQVGKLNYYAYYSQKTRDGYRKNEHTDYNAQGIRLNYDFSKKLSVAVEWARSSYLYRIPGPLTDAMFYADPRQATRARNYFSPTINIPSATLQWAITENTKLQFTSSAVLGYRNSVLFDKTATIRDSIVTATQTFNNRQVDIDNFNSYTQELRILNQYSLFGKQKSALAAGVQLMNNRLHRTQLGKGTTGSDYDLTLVEPTFGRDLTFRTQNIALFAENNFALNTRWSVNIGARMESGESKMSGKIVYYPENKIPLNIQHRYPLFGTSFNYKVNPSSDIYGGVSQVYRPMIFKDLIPASTFEKVDPNIRDANGYNAEIGYRGSWKALKWDITGFILQYNRRFGTLILADTDSTFYTYRTNIGNSTTQGIEFFLQGDWHLGKKIKMSAFTSSSLMNGIYTTGIVKSGTENINIKGKKIESVPDLISRNGVTLQYQKFSLSGLYSYTAATFADALNTEKPSANGAVGLVPAYGLLDINASAKISKNTELRISVNNVMNEQYFTKRPTFYPGAGVWSSDGRNMNFTVNCKI